MEYFKRMTRLISFLVLSLFILSCNEDKKYITPEVKDITESVYSSITLQPDSLYEAHAAATGLVQKILVEEGDEVSLGQVLIKIKGEKVKYGEKNAELNLQLARENLEGKSAILKDLRDQIEVADLKFRNDSLNYARQQRIHSKGVGSEVDLESRKLAYQSSRNNLEVLKQQLDRSQTELQTALKQAELNYKTNVSTVQDYLITSEINGKVYDILVNEGELVSGQFPVALIGDSEKYIIEMLVDEVDIVKVKKGQKVIISLDAYKGQVYQAEVTRILPNMNQRTQTFKVEGQFLEPPEVLYPGLSGEANIVINEKKNALTIPIEYLKGGSSVSTKDGMKEVETGLKSMTHAEIISGIDSTTHIYKPEK